MTWAGAPATLAPPHVPAGTPLGRVGGEPRRDRAGLAGAEGAVLVVGGHDHAAAAVGAGAAGEGDVLDSCGTAEAILRATAPLDPETVRARSGTASRSAATRSRAATSCRARSGRARSFKLSIDGYGEDSTEYRAALEEVGAAGADILARMEALAGPYAAARDHRRVVGPAARSAR